MYVCVCTYVCTVDSVIVFILPLQELKIWEVMCYSTISLNEEISGFKIEIQFQYNKKYVCIYPLYCQHI